MWHLSHFSSNSVFYFTRSAICSVYFYFHVFYPHFYVLASPLLFYRLFHSLLFVAVLDRHLPFMEPRELPRGSEPTLPFQSGLGARYPPLQQVGYTQNLSYLT